MTRSPKAFWGALLSLLWGIWWNWGLSSQNNALYTTLLIQLKGSEGHLWHLQLAKHLPGEGDGTPLQYSCLETPMDRGAWWAAVHGVARSQARLSDFTFTFHLHALEKEMATRSSVLAWRIPGMGEPGGLPSMGSHRIGHDWSDLAAAAWSSILTHHWDIWQLSLDKGSRGIFGYYPGI